VPSERSLMVTRPIWQVTPGTRSSSHSGPTVGFVDWTMIPIRSRYPKISGTQPTSKSIPLSQGLRRSYTPAFVLASISLPASARRASGVRHTDRGALAMHAPYFELAWSRFFAHLRPSRYAGAPPILEALVIGPLARLRVVVDVGEGSALQACRTAKTLALTTRMRRRCGNSIFRETPWLRVCRDRVSPSWAHHSNVHGAVYDNAQVLRLTRSRGRDRR
jgi:hypothetical protein